ncbi:carbon-nitrogen hydrolase family protein [Mesorhizobium sp. CGMCC 1.15528]|uniref:Carbon-nitrogen hydrolase family protein n=1 Tax=Mesorhizobium zhangyense TaxID=1776730 RepID=A0A7C9R8K3_9HYPH|nr:carbon-nitrogen hydrolase family protein [Mesorhizobium zhangyense]NGN42757.1 carbon-nitrogen hydrolase family protein [Mesorhizobium zhangyense]
MMKLAALQMQAVAGDVAANLARIERAAREAAKGGADLLVTPELAVTGYGAGEATKALAEPADGDLAARLSALSAETGIAMVVGFAERAGETIYNSALYVDGSAAPVVYRKSHLYGAYERGLFLAEKPAACVVNHRGAKIGLLICYDVEFPENVRRLAQAGVDAVIVPTALPASDHDEFIARKLIPVRAFENQIFVAYVNHCGADALFSYAGLSGIAAPDGTLLAEAGRGEEALLLAEVRPADYAASAATNSYLADLRV